MGIIECDEYKHIVSTKESLCPNCGAPVKKNFNDKKKYYTEVIIKKEKKHPINTIIYIGFFISLIIICLYDFTLIKTFRNAYSLTAAHAEPTFNLNTNIYSGIIINTTFISCIITLFSKKTYKLSKIVFIVNLITHILFFNYIYSHNFRIDIQFYILYILNIIYLLLPRLNKTEEITTLIKKNKIFETEIKNKKIEDYYNKKTYTKTYKTIILLLVISSIIILFIIIKLNNKPIHHETVIQTKTDYQIEITNDYINVRQKATTKSEKIGEVNHGDVYNVLDVIGGENYIWYKIKYKNKIGYISSSRKKAYIKELYNDSLIVNVFCDTSKKCKNYYNQLLKYKNKNNIFLINYIDVSDSKNENLFNKITKYFKDEQTVPYIVIGTERIHSKNIYKETIYYINNPIDREYNLVDIIKKDNKLPILKPQGINNSSFIIE